MLTHYIFVVYRTRLRRSAIPSIFPWNDDLSMKTNVVDLCEVSIASDGHQLVDGAHGSPQDIFVSNNASIELDIDEDDGVEASKNQDDCDIDVDSFSSQDVSNDHSGYCVSHSSSGNVMDTIQEFHEPCDQDHINLLIEESLTVDKVPGDHRGSSAKLTADAVEVCFSNSLDVYEEVVQDDSDDTVNDTIDGNYQSEDINLNNIPGLSHGISGLARSEPRYFIEYFINKPESLLHCTGLENYEKFMTVFRSLGPAVHNLKYIRKLSRAPSVVNQFLMVLWKLRGNESDVTLVMHFDTDRASVGSIFITWIIFMSQQWSLIDMWPSRELVDLYMPDTFKLSYPKVRGIVDGTEFEIERPTNPRDQQSTFSQYKNRNTMKAGLMRTPGGLTSYHTPAYGGSTSDRQLIGRCDFLQNCQPGDVIMADKGFNVQDL
ncbi:hypothetical protein QAD02_003110 [Eretmocerus hayati]|uniref:Uncharacterized protein n=1 Tax=Eretmocerus hayati TaxID=131215 RepID=A0ACC2NLQ8_9HYME|nr:hypothetical protein QAD02_003110 [Eretmocerus hayati]